MPAHSAAARARSRCAKDSRVINEWRHGPSCPAGRGKIAGPGPRNSERRAPAGQRLSEGARRGGWLGRREGANRSVARYHVRIRARPRTTPEVVSKMVNRPFPTVSHGAWTPGKAPPRRTGVPACGFLRPLPDAPYRPDPLRSKVAVDGRRAYSGHMRARLPVLYLLFASLVFGAPKWIKLQSPHFTVLSDGDPADARTIADQLERLRWAFLQAYPSLKFDASAPTEVFAVRNKKELLEAAPASMQGQGQLDWSGVYLGSPYRDYMLLR